MYFTRHVQFFYLQKSVYLFKVTSSYIFNRKSTSSRFWPKSSGFRQIKSLPGLVVMANRSSLFFDFQNPIYEIVQEVLNGRCAAGIIESYKARIGPSSFATFDQILNDCSNGCAYGMVLCPPVLCLSVTYVSSSSSSSYPFINVTCPNARTCTTYSDIRELYEPKKLIDPCTLRIVNMLVQLNHKTRQSIKSYI